MVAKKPKISPQEEDSIFHSIAQQGNEISKREVADALLDFVLESDDAALRAWRVSAVERGSNNYEIVKLDEGEPLFRRANRAAPSRLEALYKALNAIKNGEPATE